jgi:hypothetical protein
MPTNCLPVPARVQEPGLAVDSSVPLRVRTEVRAGADGLATNHSEALVVRTEVRAGDFRPQHSQAVRRVG